MNRDDDMSIFMALLALSPFVLLVLALLGVLK
jgi:hypothetical protein